MKNGKNRKAIGRAGVFFLPLIAVLSLVFLAPAKAQTYPTAGTCGDLPRIDIPVAPGYCLALVAENLKFPRGILPLDGGDILVAEMIGWGSAEGRISLLTWDQGHYRRKILIRHLRQPHSLAQGPDGRIYVGVLGGVKRFSLASPLALEDVIGGASGIEGPPGDGRHPLTSFLFTKAGDLILNVGSASNNCEDAKEDPPDPDQPCAEGEDHALLRLYRFEWPAGSVKDWRVLAYGLRNSIGLAEDAKTGLLLQAENGRDDIGRFWPKFWPALANDDDLPPDEINEIKPRAHYGWPYCYGDNHPNPEYADWDCSPYKGALIEVPAHAAPLGLVWWRDKLFVGYHGYRRNGHLIVAYDRGADGKPAGNPIPIIAPWDDANGRAPQGAPVDLKVGPDGALYISEDRNGTILRLSHKNGP